MGKLIYLAGSMELASDGETWRSDATKELKKLGFNSWNPYTEEPKSFNGIPAFKKIINLDRKKDFKEIHKIMKKIIILDLGTINNSVDALMVKYDSPTLLSAGTHSEMSLAAYKNIPVHLWLCEDVSINRIPAWVLGCITTIAYNFEDTIVNIKKSLK